jgi:hypothetical protein
VPSVTSPAVVLAAGAGGRLEVDLFDLVLTDVGGPEVARLPVEREAPGIAEAVGPDLGEAVSAVGERVVGGDGVGALPAAASTSRRRILPSRASGVLGVVLRVAAGAAVAETGVEVAVRAEHDQAAVVVGERVGNGEQDLAAGGVGAVGVVGGDAVAGDRVVAGAFAPAGGVADEELSVGGVVGVEGDAE